MYFKQMFSQALRMNQAHLFSALSENFCGLWLLVLETLIFSNIIVPIYV